MARINWLPNYDRIDNQTMQEIFVSDDGHYTKAGQYIKFCPSCGRWVPQHDYVNYCLSGFHEFSKEIALPIASLEGKAKA